MRILLLGDYSNVHWTLAEGLRALGHECVVASDGDHWKDYPRDIDLKREFSIKGNLSFLFRLMKALPKFRGFDIVQIINPIFVELKAERMKPIYDYIRRHNKKIVMAAYGMDYYWVDVNTRIRPLKYSDFNFGDTIRTDKEAEIFRNVWIGTAKETLNKYIAKDCDAIVSGLYEYQITYENTEHKHKTQFIPYPIKPTTPSNSHTGGRTEGRSKDDNDSQVCLSSPKKKINIFIGISRNRSAYKGTDIMLKAVKRIAEEYPDRVNLLIAEGVPFAQYTKMLDKADVILDQLYSYTPAMNALEAMNRGTIVVGGGEEEQYEILKETELRPIINVQPTEESVYEELKNLILNSDIQKLKNDSKEYIRRHHDYIKVARQYEALYKELL